MQNQKAEKPEPSTFEKVANNSVTKSIMRTAGNTIVRSLLGSLGLGEEAPEKKGTSWFKTFFNEIVFSPHLIHSQTKNFLKKYENILAE